MATDPITYEKEQLEAIDGFDTSLAAVHSHGEDHHRDREIKSLKVTYLDVDDVLIKGCGADCPWLGLFHVEMDASEFSKFLSNIARPLIPALRKALRKADVEKEQIKGALFKLGEAGFPRAGAGNAVAFAGQQKLEAFTNFGLVIDNQYQAHQSLS